MRNWDRGRCYRQAQYREILPSGYSINQTGGALDKCWIGYCTARSKWEFDLEIMYAKRIRKLQRELGLELSDFKILH